MTGQPAPVRVCRIGGAVKTFDEPREVWKKAHLPDRECLVRMELPAGERLVYPAKPSHSWNNTKLRASRVYVRAIEEIDGGETPERIAESPHVKGFQYRVGELAEPIGFCEDTSTVDGAGIHCFATREGAEWWGKRNFDPATVGKTHTIDGQRCQR